MIDTEAYENINWFLYTLLFFNLICELKWRKHLIAQREFNKYWGWGKY